MRVYLGSDHAGFELKARVIEHLRASATTRSTAALDPRPGRRLPAAVHRRGRPDGRDPGSLGIVIGGSGNGEQIAANKVKGVRAALVWSDETARLAREHNDANIISLGARNHPVSNALRFVEIFLDTPFSQDARHIRRIGQLTEYEQTGHI